MIVTIALAATVFILLGCVVSSRRKKLKVFSAMGVQGPEPNMLFGNLHEFASKKSYEAYSNWTQHYGKTYGIYEGSSPVLVTSDPDILREVFVKKFSHFYGRRLFPIQPEPDTGADKDVHILFSRGSRWKRLRTTISPGFSTVKIKQMLPLINTCIDQFMELLDAKCKAKEDFDIHRAMQAMTMNVIASCAFGLSPTFQRNESDPFLLRCRRLFEDFARKPWIMILGALFPELRNFWWKACKLISSYTYDDMDWLFNNLGSVIEARQKEPFLESNGGQRVDFLQLLLDAEVSNCSYPATRTLSSVTTTDSDEMQPATTCNNNNNKCLSNSVCSYDENAVATCPTTYLRDSDSCRMTQVMESSLQISTAAREKGKLSMDEVKANSVVFLVGGYETTSNLISYVAYELANHPDCQRRLQEELDSVLSSNDDFTYENITRLQYLEMVVKEALRMYPMGMLLTGRTCMKTIDVGGLCIPQGMTVQPDVWSLHHDPLHWGAAPYVFDPDRFLPGAMANRDPTVYMPFGAGPKNCVGMRFALTQCKFAIARLLAKYSLEATPHTRVELSEGTLNPKNGIILRVVERE